MAMQKMGPYLGAGPFLSYRLFVRGMVLAATASWFSSSDKKWTGAAMALAMIQLVILRSGANATRSYSWQQGNNHLDFSCFDSDCLPIKIPIGSSHQSWEQPIGELV